MRLGRVGVGVWILFWGEGGFVWDADGVWVGEEVCVVWGGGVEISYRGRIGVSVYD